jgi:excisionase family DNA binding protein
MTNNLLNVEQAAEFLGLKPSTIRSWIVRRRISYVKLGDRAVRIRLSDLEALVHRTNSSL